MCDEERESERERRRAIMLLKKNAENSTEKKRKGYLGVFHEYLVLSSGFVIDTVRLTLRIF